MCGIFGFVSTHPKKVQEILEGLKTLEYRGYDSWGIAVKSKGSKITLERHTGKIGNATLGPNLLNNDVFIGIGHTRWATHGGVTVENSHPHVDCSNQIALVHNGIVENYEILKEDLEMLGHTFKSQTDSEVIVHLIEEQLRTYGFATAVRNSFNKIQGLNAFVVLNTLSSEIIAAKNGSPLIVGVGANGYYIASDVSAIIPHSDSIVVLSDNQMVILGSTLKMLTLPDGKPVDINYESIGEIEETHTKGSFDHFMLKEIHEQPEILRNLYKLENEAAARLARDIEKAFGTFMLGCGTASYAALAGEYYFSKIANKHINFAVGSEFKYIQDFINIKSLIIPISQSGETIDVVEPVQNAKKKGAKIVSVVNVPTSTLARSSDYALLLHAGQEKAVVGTKSFTAMVALLLLVAHITKGQTNIAMDLISKTATDVEEILEPSNITKIKNLALELKKHDHAFTLGRGISYVAALEGALKLKETSLLHAEGFAGGELKHGVMALIEKGTPCFVFAPNDETYAEILSNAQEVKARGAFIVGIGPKQNSVFDAYLKTADLGDATLISQTVYMQLLAYYLALERGVEDPDKPRNLAKSVTVK